jgi:pSer/pThr/pTyr-binding forkhead associated (FHA) protein
MSGTAWLVDERWQKAYPIASPLSIGRGPDNAVILRDPAVSRVHAMVCGEANDYLLRSFGASGTIVNGSPAGGECVLHEGDRIAIASSTLRFTRQAPDQEMIVLPHDTPVSLDRLAPATRAFAVPDAAKRAARPASWWALLATLAFLAGSVLIFLALR